MLTIRLSRVGKPKQPVYRLIISEKGRDTWGRALEFLGQYNPRANPKYINFNAERVKYWLSKGAQTSDTVRNLLIDQKIIEGKKTSPVAISKKRRTKLAEKAKAAASAAPSSVAAT